VRGGRRHPRDGRERRCAKRVADRVQRHRKGPGSSGMDRQVRHRATLPGRARGCYPPSGEGGIRVWPVISGIRMPSLSG
jgi:hypothetical protein